MEEKKKPQGIKSTRHKVHCLASYDRSKRRHDYNRRPGDPKPGFKPPPGKAQVKIPFLFHRNGIKPSMLIPLERGDNRPVSERVKA